MDKDIREETQPKRYSILRGTGGSLSITRYPVLAGCREEEDLARYRSESVALARFRAVRIGMDEDSQRH